MEHRTEVIPDLNVRGMYTAVCSCGRCLNDTTKEDADREAREHEEGIEQPWVIPKGQKIIPWSPSKHPIENFRMRPEPAPLEREQRDRRS